jgi:hypothetical protein
VYGPGNRLVMTNDIDPQDVAETFDEELIGGDDPILSDDARLDFPPDELHGVPFADADVTDESLSDRLSQEEPDELPEDDDTPIHPDDLPIDPDELPSTPREDPEGHPEEQVVSRMSIIDPDDPDGDADVEIVEIEIEELESHELDELDDEELDDLEDELGGDLDDLDDDGQGP